MAVYSVKTAKGLRLVEARTVNAARNHVIKDEVEVKTLNTSELVKFINDDGLKIETVKDEEPKAADTKASAPGAVPGEPKASEEAPKASSAPDAAAKADTKSPAAAEPAKKGIFGTKN